MSSCQQRSYSRVRGMRWRRIIVAVAGSALVAGCGSTMASTTASKQPQATQPASAQATQTAPQTFSQTTTTASSSADLTGPVGTDYSDTDSSGNVMAVKLTQVMDPAKGSDEFNTPDNGKRFVGAKFTITGKSGTFSDDANSDAALVGSDGQSYTPDFNDIAGCTNFNAGEFSVTSGVSSTGCVVFQVPQHVHVASVQWNSGFDGAPATWTPSTTATAPTVSAPDDVGIASAAKALASICVPAAEASTKNPPGVGPKVEALVRAYRADPSAQGALNVMQVAVANLRDGCGSRYAGVVTAAIAG